MKQKLKIVLDIDQCICDFANGFSKYFNCNYATLSITNPAYITNCVNSLKTNTKFWESLPTLCSLDFIPHAYCTARINSKYSTKVWLKKNNFPNSPVYYVDGYDKSKVPQLKRICNKGEYLIFVDDKFKNVEDAQKAGFNAFLLDTPYNRNVNTNLRIPDLKYKTIENAFRRIYF